MRCDTICFDAMRCKILYCTVLYCTVLYCTVLYCTVLYCTVLCDATCGNKIRSCSHCVAIGFTPPIHVILRLGDTSAIVAAAAAECINEVNFLLRIDVTSFSYAPKCYDIVGRIIPGTSQHSSFTMALSVITILLSSPAMMLDNTTYILTNVLVQHPSASRYTYTAYRCYQYPTV